MSRPCAMLITSRLVSSPNLSAISHTGTWVPMSLATCATQHNGVVVEMLKGTGARKYVIAKLLSAPEGGTEFFGMAEIWYDNLEDALKATQNSVARRDSPFTERITDMRRVYVLEEEEIHHGNSFRKSGDALLHQWGNSAKTFEVEVLRGPRRRHQAQRDQAA